MSSEKKLTALLEKAECDVGSIHSDDCDRVCATVVWGSPSNGVGPCNCGVPERMRRFVAAVRDIITELETGGGNTWAPDYYEGLNFALLRLAEVYES